jgi:hypothetical protein
MEKQAVTFLMVFRVLPKRFSTVRSFTQNLHDAILVP